MKYFILGIIAGILFSIVPVWNHSGAVEIYPEWQCGIGAINSIEESPNPQITGEQFSVVNQPDISILTAKGRLIKKINTDSHLFSVCRSGNYYVLFDKIGTHIEMRNPSGDRFWRIKSREYPYITTGGKIILLMNGDHSMVRVIDVNGNITGAKEIAGGLCDIISLPENSDNSGVGFLDGSYYILDDKGDIITKGVTDASTMVKGISVSRSGRYSAVHYGNNRGDFLRWIDAKRGKFYSIPLKNISLTRSSMNINDEGNIAAFDYDRIIITDKDDIETVVKIPPKKSGLSSIEYHNNIYTAAYMGTDGRANFFIFLADGTILFHKIFTEESYIESSIFDNTVVIKGSMNLYTYSIYRNEKTGK